MGRARRATPVAPGRRAASIVWHSPRATSRTESPLLTSRRVALVVLAAALVVPPAAFAQFGSVELVDPVAWPDDGFQPDASQLVVDGSGKASWLSRITDTNGKLQTV